MNAQERQTRIKVLITAMVAQYSGWPVGVIKQRLMAVCPYSDHGDERRWRGLWTAEVEDAMTCLPMPLWGETIAPGRTAMKPR